MGPIGSVAQGAAPGLGRAGVEGMGAGQAGLSSLQRISHEMEAWGRSHDPQHLLRVISIQQEMIEDQLHQAVGLADEHGRMEGALARLGQLAEEVLRHIDPAVRAAAAPGASGAGQQAASPPLLPGQGAKAGSPGAGEEIMHLLGRQLGRVTQVLDAPAARGARDRSGAGSAPARSDVELVDMMQRASLLHQTITNLLRTQHDMARAAIMNIR